MGSEEKRGQGSGVGGQCEYQPVPVEAAREIAEKYGKSIVIINCVDAKHGLVHTTTFGQENRDKAWAKAGGDITAKALGVDFEKRITYEELPTVDPGLFKKLAKIAVLSDEQLTVSGRRANFPELARLLDDPQIVVFLESAGD